MDPSPSEFRSRFQDGFPPEFAQQLVGIIEDAATQATAECERMFKAGNYGQTHGTLRYQILHDRCRTEAFHGGIVAEARDYRGYVLEGEERDTNFTLLRSGKLGMIVFRASQFRRLPKPSRVIQYLSTLPYSTPPILPLVGAHEQLPRELDALYVTRFWLDPWESTKSTVKDVDVIVLDATARAQYCHVVDLRAYAATEVTPATDVDRLPIEVLHDSPVRPAMYSSDSKRPETDPHPEDASGLGGDRQDE